MDQRQYPQYPQQPGGPCPPYVQQPGMEYPPYPPYGGQGSAAPPYGGPVYGQGGGPVPPRAPQYVYQTPGSMPGVPGGNWAFRVTEEALRGLDSGWLLELNRTYFRSSI